MQKKMNSSKKYFWLLLVIFLASFLYLCTVKLLVTARQTDSLLIVSIIASTISMWGAWYSFLKKWRLLYFWGVMVCVFSIWLVFMAVMDVINPQLL